MGAGLVNVDIGQIMNGAGQFLKDIRTAWTGKNPELEAKLAELQFQFDAARDAAQSAINQIDAASASKFQSWWRPAVAWVCVLAFAINYLIFPIINYILAFFDKSVATPAFDSGELMTLLFGLLGLGGLRTYEKYKGIAK